MAKRKSPEEAHVTPEDVAEAVAAARRDRLDMGDDPTPSREGRATGAGKGFRIGPGGKKYSQEEIIEHARGLLGDGHTHGDVKRALAKLFGGRGASFQKHIAIARKRNLSVLNKDLGQTKSESLKQWFTSLQQAKGFRDVAFRELVLCQQKLNAVQLKIDDPATKAMELSKLLDSRDDLRKTYDIAFERYQAFDTQVARNQKTIDGIVGNNAPYEFKIESKVEVETKPEPLTHEDAAKELAELLLKLGK